VRQLETDIYNSEDNEPNIQSIARRDCGALVERAMIVIARRCCSSGCMNRMERCNMRSRSPNKVKLRVLTRKIVLCGLLADRCTLSLGDHGVLSKATRVIGPVAIMCCYF